MEKAEYVPMILGVPMVRATGQSPAWHVEWWERGEDGQDHGPYMVVGCTAESAGLLVRVFAADRERYHLVGAYDIADGPMNASSW